MKVQPCFSSILWQSDTRSPRKMSPCFPESTQFSYISRFWGVGRISQKTWIYKYTTALSQSAVQGIFKKFPLWRHSTVPSQTTKEKKIIKQNFPNPDSAHLCSHLASSQYVIPHWGSSKVDVKVCVAALHTHQTIPANKYNIFYRKSYCNAETCYQDCKKCIICYTYYCLPSEMQSGKTRRTYFCTLGYCMSLIEFVESRCLSFKWRGHILSPQSIRSTLWQTTTWNKCGIKMDFDQKWSIFRW